MTEPERRHLAGRWVEALSEASITTGLESIYADAAAAIAERGPACWASGRCCNFEKAGHLLYVTGLEAAYCIDRLGSTPERTDGHALPVLSRQTLDAAAARGGCPFQVRNLCGVHAIKPLGCRVYFCDRSAQEWQMTLSERLIGEIKSLHDRHDVPYRYGEWRAMLNLFRT
ncbi:MAG: hypothetical protein IT438_01310 [Phycisphaerales bacterium]|nr:hypothetical protein [Phycisphaerales bacterium]